MNELTCIDCGIAVVRGRRQQAPLCAACARARMNARCRRYYRANKDRILAEDRALYVLEREARVARSRQWQIDNPDRHAANEQARRAKTADLFVEFVHPLVVLELADGVCGICGTDVDPGDFQVDHIEPLSLGGEHSYTNTQPAHPRCNMQKGNRAA